jgi:hypothetical protein
MYDNGLAINSSYFLDKNTEILEKHLTPEELSPCI